MRKNVSTFDVYLRGGQTFRVKAVDITLRWDNAGNVTEYNFNWGKTQPRTLGMPPQSIIGVRRVK